MVNSTTYMITGFKDSDDIMLKDAFEGKVAVILKEIEKTAAQHNLAPKQSMHLRLLTEELICMMPQILQYGTGTFWVSCEYLRFELHIKVRPEKVKDAAPKAKPNTLGGTEKVSMLKRISKAVESAIKSTSEYKGTTWSLQQYISEVKMSDRTKNLSAWDELEKSIIANIADDVTVSSKLGEVEVTVVKDFG